MPTPAWPFEGTPPLAVEVVEDRTDAGALTASVFDAYRPSVRVPGARPHPTRLVESAAMAAASAPPRAYRPTLPGHLVTEGHLSDAQLETVVRAGSAHAEHLPGSGEETGPGQGFFLGDGTGVGGGGGADLGSVSAPIVCSTPRVVRLERRPVGV